MRRRAGNDREGDYTDFRITGLRKEAKPTASESV
jgi:hypothetical protein